jgi:Spy/CpxP family protein refolding chaperone
MIFRTKTIGVTGSLLVAVCLWALPAHAQLRPGPHERGGMAGDGTGIALPLLLRGANLTPDQKAQVQQIMANHRSSFRDLFSQPTWRHSFSRSLTFATSWPRKV